MCFLISEITLLVSGEAGAFASAPRGKSRIVTRQRKRVEEGKENKESKETKGK